MAWQRVATMAMWLTRVRRLFGHKASACLHHWEPTNDGLACARARREPCCYFDRLFGQGSEHIEKRFDWLLWLGTEAFWLQDKPFGYLILWALWFWLYPTLCGQNKASKLLWCTIKSPCKSVRWNDFTSFKFFFSFLSLPPLCRY